MIGSTFGKLANLHIFVMASMHVIQSYIMVSNVWSRCYVQLCLTFISDLKLGYIEFVMAGVGHSDIVNPAGQLLSTRRVNNS